MEGGFLQGEGRGGMCVRVAMIKPELLVGEQSLEAKRKQKTGTKGGRVIQPDRVNGVYPMMPIVLSPVHCSCHDSEEINNYQKNLDIRWSSQDAQARGMYQMDHGSPHYCQHLGEEALRL